MTGLRVAHDKTIDPPEESLDALDAGVLPIEVAVRGSGEQHVETCAVGAVAGDHFIRRNHIPAALGHGRALVGDHPLREEAPDGFVVLDQSQVAHHLGPEARVDQVQDGVFDAANVLIDGKPIRDGLGIEGRLIVTRVGVAIEIPGRIDERVHGVGLASGGAAAPGAHCVHELGHTTQG